VFDANWLDDFGARFDSSAGQGTMPLNMAINDVKWDRTAASSRTVEGYIKEGKAYRADTIEELAQQMEVPPETLRATVDRYNELCDMGDDPRLRQAPELLTRIVKPPFIAVQDGRLPARRHGRLPDEHRSQRPRRRPPAHRGSVRHRQQLRRHVRRGLPAPAQRNSYGRAFSYALVLAACSSDR
jgi:hypothetical protein